MKNKMDDLLTRAESLGDQTEIIDSAEIFLLCQIASAASDWGRSRHWEEFRERYPVKDMEENLNDAVVVWEQFTREY